MVRKLLKLLTPVDLIDYYRRIRYSKFKKNSKFYGKTIHQTFEEIYMSDYWKGQESKSGTGSDSLQASKLQKELPKIFKNYNIKSILDIPCGDFNWMKKIDLSQIRYLGGDIVPGIIEKNVQHNANDNISFKVLDLTTDKLPQVDLIICRDCLVHFSYEHIYKALSNILLSNSKYLLVTSFNNRKFNYDITTGDWRPLNLEIFPFDFSDPVLKLDEVTTDKEFNDKQLLMWEIKNLKLPSMV